jgi:hypothetical protein
MISHLNNDRKLLRTVWCVPDDLWQKLKPLLNEYDPSNAVGRKRIDAHAALNAIILCIIKIACALTLVLSLLALIQCRLICSLDFPQIRPFGLR